MRSPLRLHRAIVAIALLSAVVLGCGSDDDAAAVPSTTTAPPVAGTVTLDMSGATDASNRVMVAVIGKNVPTQPFGAACAIVDADPFSFTGEFFPITGGDPCSLGTEPVQLDPGSYDVIVAVMEGGATSPELCAEANVTVNGDVTVEVTSLGPPTNCNF